MQSTYTNHTRQNRRVRCWILRSRIWVAWSSLPWSLVQTIFGARAMCCWQKCGTRSSVHRSWNEFTISVRQWRTRSKLRRHVSRCMEGQTRDVTRLLQQAHRFQLHASSQSITRTALKLKTKTSASNLKWVASSKVPPTSRTSPEIDSHPQSSPNAALPLHLQRTKPTSSSASFNSQQS
jgi:hypothetical protein